MKQITLDEFEAMALEAIKDAEITDCEQLLVSFKKWKSMDGSHHNNSPFYVCFYCAGDNNCSGSATTPQMAIYEAIQAHIKKRVATTESEPIIRYEG